MVSMIQMLHAGGVSKQQKACSGVGANETTLPHVKHALMVAVNKQTH